MGQIFCLKIFPIEALDILQYKIDICLLWPSQGGILDNLTYYIVKGKFSYWGPK